MTSLGRGGAEVGVAIDEARSFADWKSAAAELDRSEGLAAWREIDESRHFDAGLLRNHLEQLREHRRSGDYLGLAELLHDSLYRNLGELANPALYLHARCGPKHVVDVYLDEVEGAVVDIADADVPGVSRVRKLELLEQAAHNLGRSALMLSGGATMGLFHAGVVKALWQEGILPRALSGASTGAIIAAATCTRTDTELGEIFADPSLVDTHVFEAHSPAQILRGEGVMSQENLLRSIRANIPDMTFLEAHRHSGRILNIAVSPTRMHQKPRLLNHLTAPELLIPHAVLASSAIPGVFPPAVLMARDAQGNEVLHGPDDKWIDGTIHSDLPMLRIGRLFNVNHFIVSQTNPHLVPFVSARRGRGIVPLLSDLALSSVHAQWVQLLGVAERHLPWHGLRRVVDAVHGASDQRIMGDIDIHPPLSFWNYGKVFSNATSEDFEHFILQGERATWPKIAMIRNHTRVSRALERAMNNVAAE